VWSADRQRWSTGQVGGTSDLFGVTCTGDRQCLAVGEDAAGAGVVASTSDGVAWALRPVPPGTGPLDSVSCAAAACLAVGADKA